MNMTDPMFQDADARVADESRSSTFFSGVRKSQRQKQLRQAVDNLRRGDAVVTAGGILGKVVKAAGADETEILIEIADNVQVKVVKATLTDVRAKGPAGLADKG